MSMPDANNNTMPSKEEGIYHASSTDQWYPIDHFPMDFCSPPLCLSIALLSPSAPFSSSASLSRWYWPEGELRLLQRSLGIKLSGSPYVDFKAPHSKEETVKRNPAVLEAAAAGKWWKKADGDKDVSDQNAEEADHSTYEPFLSERSNRLSEYFFDNESRQTHLYPMQFSRDMTRGYDLNRELLTRSFTGHSPLRSADELRRGVLDRLIEKGYQGGSTLEPNQFSAEGVEILGPATSLLSHHTTPVPVSFALIDEQIHKCLICGKENNNAPAAIGCVRDHLNLRPFACPGQLGGCLRCFDRQGPARFFTQSLLDEHIENQMKGYPYDHREGARDLGAFRASPPLKESSYHEALEALLNYADMDDEDVAIWLCRQNLPRHDLLTQHIMHHFGLGPYSSQTSDNVAQLPAYSANNQGPHNEGCFDNKTIQGHGDPNFPCFCCHEAESPMDEESDYSDCDSSDVEDAEIKEESTDGGDNSGSEFGGN